MVEYTISLDAVFGSLADPTRRDILQRLLDGELTVSEIALPYDMSLAAISKHLKILERAALIIKRKVGKERVVGVRPGAFAEANQYIASYQRLWEERFDRLDTLLKEEL